MTWSFAINLLIALVSAYSAYNDHGETYNLYKSTVGKERAKKRKKLILLWATPILSICLIPFTLSESLESNREMREVKTKLKAALGTKPIKERTIEFLNSIDPELISGLKTNQDANCITIDFPESKTHDLFALIAEKDSGKYIGVLWPQSPVMAASATGFVIKDVKICAFKKLLE